MRMRVSLLAAALLLSACAGPGELSPAAAQDLQAHVAAVRESAEAMDAGAATAELEALRGAVAHWLETGDLDRARADEILAAADDVESALALLPAPAEEPPPPEEEPAPQEPEVEEPSPEATEAEDEPEEEQDDDEDDVEEDDDSSGPGSEGSDAAGTSGPG